MTPKQLARLCAKCAHEKIATDISVMDLAPYDNAPCDFFVVCSAESNIQAKAIADYILRQAKNNKIPKPAHEGTDACEWILIDFFDVVVHIMLPEIRTYYNIEKLWQNAKTSTLNTATGRLVQLKN